MKVESTKIKKWRKKTFEEGGGTENTGDDFITVTISDSLKELDYELPKGIDEDEFITISVGWESVPIKIKELELMINFIKDTKLGEN